MWQKLASCIYLHVECNCIYMCVYKHSRICVKYSVIYIVYVYNANTTTNLEFKE